MRRENIEQIMLEFSQDICKLFNAERIGLHELLVADDHIKRLVQERARVAEIFTAAVESGMRTLKMDGMEKVMLGWTDLKQVRSVCIK
jgi:type II secretory ATPase GspE/PulE/Tfp pilus assembly ATPase PilB-like protein